MALRKTRKEKSNAAPAEKRPGGVNLAVMFGMMLLVFLVGAGMVIGYFEFFSPDRQDAASEKKDKQEVMQALELGDMVVNLADQGGNHFLKLTITLEFPADKKMAETVNHKKHLITETILLTLRGKTMDQVRPPGAVDNLKMELINAVNHQLGEDMIKKIYFTEFIVQ